MPARNSSFTAFAERPRLGLLLGGLVVWILVTLVVSTFLTPPVFSLVDHLAPGRFPFQRVFRRVALAAALVFLVVWLRRAGIRRFADVGLGWSPGRWRVILINAAVAALVFGGLVALDAALGVRIWIARPPLTKLLQFVIAAAAIALLEEGLCRGALLFPFGRFTGARFLVAATAVSAVYSLAHYARGSGRTGSTDWRAAWGIWASVPEGAMHFRAALVGLFLAGFFLYLYAWRQGHAWGAIGLHAGAVLGLQVMGALTDPLPGASSYFLANGLLPGWGVSVGLAVGIAILARRPPRPFGDGPA